MANVLRAFTKTKLQLGKSKSNISTLSRGTSGASGETCFSAEELPPKKPTTGRNLMKLTTQMMTMVGAKNSKRETPSRAGPSRDESLDSMNSGESSAPVLEPSHVCRERLREALGELGVGGLHTELVLKLDSLCSTSRARGVREDIAWFRDVLLKEAWCMVGAAVAEHKAAAARAQEKASDTWRLHLDMEAAYLHETSSLRDQMRTLPRGVSDHLNMDVSFFEPLKYLDESTCAVVTACVEEKVKQIFGGKADIWGDPHVAEMLEARIAERVAALQKRLDESERARADLEREKSRLEASVRDLGEQADVMERASRTWLAERAEQEAAYGRLARDLAEAREELRRAGEELELARRRPEPVQVQAAPAAREDHSRRTLDDAASQMRAACLSAATGSTFAHDGETDSLPVPDSLATLGREDWTMLRGASSGVILAHATEVKDKLESKNATATSLLAALQQLVQQLDTECLTTVADTHQDVFWEPMVCKLLPVRMGAMRQESAAVWQLVVFLASSLRKLGETNETRMGAQLKARTLAQQLTDTASTAESMVFRCFRTMQKSYLDVEGSRKELGGVRPSPETRKPPAAGGGDKQAQDMSQSASLLEPPYPSSTPEGSSIAESARSDASPVGLPITSGESLILGKPRRLSGSGKAPSMPTTPPHIADSLPIVPTSPKAATPKSVRSGDKGSSGTVARAAQAVQKCKPGGLHGRRASA